MDEAPKPPVEELDVGLEVYYTDVLPIGGKLKKEPEDFIVNEISDKPPEKRGGEYTIARVTVRNWETNRLIKLLSQKLGISKRRIGFAGTKDKRAITSQLMSFKCPIDDVLSISLKDVKIEDAYQSNRELTIGDLYGNDFRITIRDITISKNETQQRADNVIQTLLKIGGAPNFFGIQRFGSIRPITHLIGRNILRRDFEQAVMTYIAYPLPYESQAAREARERLERERDFTEALDYYPKMYSFERTMIHYLSRKPGDWTGALEQVPDNLKMMFIHAYQSYLFNRILSERIRRGIPLNEPQVGDLIIPLNKKNLPDHYRYISVTSSNLNEMVEVVKRGLGFVSGIIMGRDAVFAGGEVGEIERKITSSEGIERSDYDLPEVRGLSSKGIRRELISPLFDLKWRVNELLPGDVTLELVFTLYKGDYATSFVRELIKGGLLDY